MPYEARLNALQGVFTFLLDQLGVQDVQFEELVALDVDALQELSPLYGVIFLFRYPTEGAGRGASTQGHGQPPDGQYDPAAADRLFFASQTIQNACGTQALLSVVLNQPAITVGATLDEFRDFTTGFPPDMKGEALSNAPRIRDVHNSFARSSPFVDETTRDAAAGANDDVYHFIAYTTVDDVLYELDGLQPAPINHGACRADEFPARVIPVLQRRIGRYPATEIRFNLLALVRDLRVRARETGDAELLRREQGKRRAWMWENALRRHNFVGFAGSVLESAIEVTMAKGGEDDYERWMAAACRRTMERRSGGEDVEMG